MKKMILIVAAMSLAGCAKPERPATRADFEGASPADLMACASGVPYSTKRHELTGSDNICMAMVIDLVKSKKYSPQELKMYGHQADAKIERYKYQRAKRDADDRQFSENMNRSINAQIIADAACQPWCY